MRPRLAGTVFFLACAMGAAGAGEAAAQPKGGGGATPPPAGRDRSNSQFTLRREEAGGNEGVSARGHARAGDCAGALPLFDAALRRSQDAVLRRDRGICHDRLGNPYPAMDDYRAYVTAFPEAADAEQIRQRLTALEEQTGTGGKPGRTSEATPEMREGTATASVALGANGRRAATKTTSSGSSEESNVLGPKAGEKPQNFDYYVEQEKIRDSAQESPLRYGSGLVLGPVVHVPRFYIGSGANQDLGYGVAVGVRYSTGAVLSLISELGYAGIGTSGANSSLAGPLLMAGLEARIAISKHASDHLLLRGGVGYERLVVSGTRAVNHTIPGRFGFGYRHVFGPSVGLELLIDGGPAFVVTDSGDSRVNGLVGGSFAFVVGF